MKSVQPSLDTIFTTYFYRTMRGAHTLLPLLQPKSERRLILVHLYTRSLICLTSVTCVKCGVRSTLCWKIGSISGSTELFGL